jgi:molecular chaperone GrpE (heat shock protein)
MKLVRIEYTKQVKENEATVKRYRKMIEEEKVFAVTKFAKDLLEVRDALRMALEHSDTEAIKKQEEISVLRDLFVSNLEGQQMTADVMDRVLQRFELK